MFRVVDCKFNMRNYLGGEVLRRGIFQKDFFICRVENGLKRVEIGSKEIIGNVILGIYVRDDYFE